MTTVDTVADGGAMADVPSERVPALGSFTPVATFVGLVVLATVTWWALGDPKWSLSKASNPADTATNLAIVASLLFWVIFGHIFTGFTFANWPFDKLSQPLPGFVHVAADLFIGVCGVLLFTRVVGTWDPTFSAEAAGGVGYTAAAFIVLIGFYAYALIVANLTGYPFDVAPSPTSSFGTWLFGAFLTMIGTVVLIYPNFNTHLAAHAPVALPTVIGWIYSSIVIVILTAMVWGNWPWSAITGRHARALVALVATLVAGYVLMLVLEKILLLIVPDYAMHAKKFALASETAQCGVCIAFCYLFWGLIIAPEPPTTLVGRVVRPLLLAGAGILVYVGFMRGFAVTVLHFPAVEGIYGGNPLLWVDWLILLMLWHAVAFGGYFSTRSAKS